MSSCSHWCGRGGQSAGGGTSGRCAHCPSSAKGRAAERAEHREHLGVADVRDHARLADVVPAHHFQRVELQHRRWRRVRQVLRGRPHARPAGDLLHHFDGRAQAAAAEQRAAPGGQPGHDRHAPLRRVVGAFESEERQRSQCIHRRRTLPDDHHPPNWRRYARTACVLTGSSRSRRSTGIAREAHRERSADARGAVLDQAGVLGELHAGEGAFVVAHAPGEHALRVVEHLRRVRGVGGDGSRAARDRCRGRRRSAGTRGGPRTARTCRGRRGAPRTRTPRG